MIVFDGDSVISRSGFGLPFDSGWAYKLAANRGKEHINLGTPESTAAKCYMRLWKALKSNPGWYVLQIGQWSLTHEPVDQFEKYLRKIIETVNQTDCKVCLVTQPRVFLEELFYAWPYVECVLRLSKVYKTHLMDLHSYMAEHHPAPWIVINDNAMCHFSIEGNQYVADLFNREENIHLCK